jgi:hypothetical protein
VTADRARSGFKSGSPIAAAIDWLTGASGLGAYWSIPMMDVVMLAIGFVFFALSIAYVYACDQL